MTPKCGERMNRQKVSHVKYAEKPRGSASAVDLAGILLLRARTNKVRVKIELENSWANKLGY